MSAGPVVSKELLNKALHPIRSRPPAPPGPHPVLDQIDTSDGREVELARCIANGMTLSQAAHSIGISVETARRWRNRPSFQRRYRNLIQQTDDATTALRARLNLIAHDAVDVLQDILDGGDEIAPKVKLEAAKTVLGHSDLRAQPTQPTMMAQVNIAVQQIQSAEDAISLLNEAIASKAGASEAGVTDHPSN